MSLLSEEQVEHSSGACSCSACMAGADGVKPPSDAAVMAVTGEPAGPEALGDAIGDDINTTATIAVGGSITNTIEAGDDKDFFRVSLEGGRAYVVHMQRTGGAGSLDPWVKFHSSTGAVIGDDDDGGIRTDSFMVLRPDASGTYYISAQSFTNAQQAATSGGYTLTLSEIPRGSTSPTVFNPSSKPEFSWDEAAIQITRSGHSWSQTFGTPVTVTYGFRSTAPADPNTPEANTTFQRFNANQITATEQALQAWGQVANINFVRVGSGNSGEAAYSNNAAILFSGYTISTQSSTSGQAFLPTTGDQSAGSVQGDVFINMGNSNNTDPVSNPTGYGVLMHEIGHALGLHHPGVYNGSENGVPTYASDAEYRQDSNQFTVMSYFPPTATGALMTGWSQMPAIHDMAAIQRLYGANMSTRTGDDTYGFNNTTGMAIYGPSISNSMYFTIWDAGGNDTLDLSGYNTNSIIDLREESFSSAGRQSQSGNPAIWNISIARGAVVENAVGGSGSDTIRGNAANNILRGGDASDQIHGGAGNDQIFGEGFLDELDGGAGADQVFGGADNDTLVARGAEFMAGEIYDGGEGVGDQLIIIDIVDLRVGTIANFERLNFRNGDGSTFNRAIVNLSQLSGFSPNLILADNSGEQSSLQVIVPSGATANLSSNTFDFGAGWSFEDYIVYTGDQGAETFIGFPGLDIFFAGSGNDVMDGREAVDFAAYIFSLDAVTADLSIQGTPQFISAHQGSDTFFSIEGLAGSQMADVLLGGNGDNFLLGLHGNDTLVGRGGADDIRGGEHSDRIDGGAGADILWGGAPADTMSGPDGADVFVYHNPTEGGDTIRDFQPGVDRIELSAAGFGLTAGAAVQLVTGVNPVASGSGPQFLLTTFDGTLSFNARLFFDADGAGAGAAVLLATLSGNTVLTAGDFIVTSIAAASIGVAEAPEAFTFAAGDTPGLDDVADMPVPEAEAAELFVADAPAADMPLAAIEWHDLQLAGVLGAESFRF